MILYMYLHLNYCNDTGHHHHEASHVRTIAIVTSIIVGTSGMIHCLSTVAKTTVIKHEYIINIRKHLMILRTIVIIRVIVRYKEICGQQRPGSGSLLVKIHTIQNGIQPWIAVVLMVSTTFNIKHKGYYWWNMLVGNVKKAVFNNRKLLIKHCRWWLVYFLLLNIIIVYWCILMVGIFLMMMMVSIFPSLDSFNITDGGWLKIHSCHFMML